MSQEHEGAEVPLVIAVVLTWNDTSMTTRCVESVLASDYPNLQVILVDNGSEAPCGQAVKDRFPAIELLVLPENQGFSGGANHGMERALERGAEYVHMIGNDSTLAGDAISRLIDAHCAHPRAGGCGPLLLFPGDPPDTVQFYSATVEREIAHITQNHVGDALAGREWPTIVSPFIPCVAIMFRATALREVGLFDEAMGTSWEDYDLCLRLSDAGWQCLTVGDARTVHVGGATTGRVSPYISYYAARNRLICIRRHGRKKGLARPWLAILRCYWWQIRGHGYGGFKCHYALGRGLLHYFLGIRGEAY